MFREIGTEIGSIVDEKNKAYGSAVEKTEQFLRLLYPEGIRPEQYRNALALVRDFDKSVRISTNNDPFGEDPWADKAGYGILMVGVNRAK